MDVTPESIADGVRISTTLVHGEQCTTGAMSFVSRYRLEVSNFVARRNWRKRRRRARRLYFADADLGIEHFMWSAFVFCFDTVEVYAA